MEKSEVKELGLDFLTMKLSLIIGETEENQKRLGEYFKENEVRFPEKDKMPKEERINCFIHDLKSCKGICLSKFINGKTNDFLVVVVVNADKVEKRKRMRKVLFHELRHMVDAIVDWRKMKFEDREFTAELQSWIDVEFLEFADEWWDKNH